MRRIGIMMLALGSLLGGTVATAAPAQAVPQSVCNINIGGYAGQYICEYGVTRLDGQGTQIFEGRKHYFVVGTDYAVWQIWETSPNSGRYSGWYTLFGVARSGVRASVWDGGRTLNIIVLGTDSRYHCNTYNSPRIRSAWTGWEVC